MSEIRALLSRLQVLGIRLALAGEDLRVDAPKGALTLALREALVASKEAIKTHLRSSADRRAEPAVGAALVRSPTPGSRTPASHMQQRLWFLRQMDPAGTVYSIPATFRVKGRLDAPAFRRALDDIVARHESLRTRFESSDGSPICVVDPEARLSLREVDVAHDNGAEERESQVSHLVDALAAEPFDLEQAPLMRALLIRLGPEEHVFSLVVDHIVADGLSIAILLSELNVLYRQHVGAASSTLPELPVQYLDYVRWEREQFDRGVLDEPLAFWRDQLAGLPPLLALPADRPRPAVQSYRGDRRILWIDPGLATRLKEVAKEHGATLYVVLMAAFQALLGRQTGEVDFAVGTAIGNRQRVEIQRVIGFFANNLVLRADLAGDPTVRELIARTRSTALRCFAHQTMPFDLLVERLVTARSLNHAPLFQVMFILHQMNLDGFELPGLEFSAMEQKISTARFDLSVDVFDLPQGLRIYLEYSTDLFDAATIDALGARFAFLLEQFARDPDATIGSLDVLPAEQREQLLLRWNGTGQSFEGEATIDRVVAVMAARDPSRVAVVCGREQLSYGCLELAAGRFAARLLEAGVGPGELVGVSLARTPAMVVALLGILKAGAAYLPLDPSFPEERLAFMVEDAGVKVVVVDADAAGAGDEARQAPAYAAGCAVLQVDSQGGPEQAAFGPVQAVNAAQDLAYVLYTSGSTGRPKGVQIEHGALLNFLRAMQQQPGLEESDRLVAVTTLSFDIAGLELFGPLSVGAQVVIASREQATDGEALAELLERHAATVLQATPATWRLLLESGWKGRAGLKMLCGGEALPAELARALLATGGELWNLYGPTETTVWSTVHRVEQVAGAAVPIGRPIANTQVYVLEPGGQPAPIGVAGELCIGGAGLARGYLNRPELTAERFAVIELAGMGPRRVYRTGDVVRWRAEGTLEYVGRRDQQVKVRGFRIELGEIEAALAAVPGVRQAVVVARNDGVAAGDARLVAYVVAETIVIDGDEPVREELVQRSREAVRRRLPEYMVPTAFVVLDALPLTPSGKIDRQALPAPDATMQVASAPQGRAPQSDTERLLAGIWSEVLNLGTVAATDDFFALGGHSLLAVKLVSRIRRQWPVVMPVRQLFDTPTLEALSARIDAEAAVRPDFGAAPSLAPTAAIVPVGRELPVPASPAQERLWFLHRLDPQSSAFNVMAALRIAADGRTEPLEPVLEAAVGDLVARHEPLRTRFALVADRLVQVIDERWNGRLERLVAEDGDGASTQATTGSACLEAITGSACFQAAKNSACDDAGAIERFANDFASRPFDLATGPLCRICWLPRKSDGILLIVAHHTIVDGWSMELLKRELIGLLDARLRGRAPQLSPLPIQYADYAAWQRGSDGRAAADRSLAFWTAALEGMPETSELPSDRERSRHGTFRGAGSTVALDQRSLDAAADLARSAGTTRFVVLLAAYAVVLARQSGQDDLCIGVPVAGRQRVELEPLPGLFANNLPVRIRLAAGDTFRALVARLHETVVTAFEHQDLAFDGLVRTLGVSGQVDRPALFQTLFNSLDFGADPLPCAPGLTVEEPPWAERFDVGSKYDLTLYVRTGTDAPTLTAVYDAERFDDRRVAACLDQYRTVLDAASRTPDAPIADISLVTPALASAIADPVRPLSPVVPFESVVARIAAHAARDPGRLAAVSDGDALTYGALARLSDQLAAFLGSRSVGHGDVVAVRAERSPALAWAMLGIWKAGASVLVLDPSYPAARRRQMVEATRAKALVDLGEAMAAAEETHDDAATAASAITIGWKARAGTPAAAWRETTGPFTVPGCRADDLAYILFTSGSTGEPKGVATTHRPLSNFLGWHERQWGLRPDDRFSVLSGLAHDPILRDVFGALWAGATACLPAQDAFGDAGYLVGFLRRHGVTIAHLTPSTAALAVMGMPADDPGVRTIRYLFPGGESLRPTAVRHLKRMAPLSRIVGFYGATETPQAVASHDLGVASELDPDRSLPLIGRGVAGSELLLLDALGRPTGVGEPAQIHVRSRYLSRGYVGAADRDGGRFVVNPATGDPGDRIYRTGDLGRYEPDGAVRWIGRADEQVKVRGFRVEVGAIESVLDAMPAIRRSAVVAFRDRNDDCALAAFVECEGGARVVTAIRTGLRGLLPAYMVPAVIAALDRLPLTPSGKVDRRQLPDPTRIPGTGEEPEPTSPLALPPSPLESALRAIWQDVLGFTRFSASDDFFALGGHSLLATRLVVRINERFGIEFPVREVFDAPTLSGQAARLAARVDPERLARADEEPESPSRRIAPAPVARSDRMPLSHMQRRLWYYRQLEPDSSAYLLSAFFHVEGMLDVARLQRALDHVVERHEALRTVFVAIDGEPFARVVTDVAVAIDCVAGSATAVSPLSRQDALTLLAAGLLRPFDPARGPLVRLSVVRLGPDEALIGLAVDHIVADGMSMQILIDELTQAYAGAPAADGPAPLPFQYADFVAGEAQRLRDGALDPLKAFWKAELAGLPAALELPTDRARPPIRSHRGARFARSVADAAWRRLKTAAGAQSVTPFMALLAAYEILVSRQSGQNDFAIGTMVANRQLSGTERLIGFFANNLVVRANLSGNPTVRELIGRVRETSLKAYEHQAIPFDVLVDALGWQRAPDRSPVFQTMLVLHPAPTMSRVALPFRATVLDHHAQASRYDLTVDVYDLGDGGLRIAYEYSTDLFDRETIERFADQYEGLLTRLPELLEHPIGSLDVLPAEQREQLLLRWNGTGQSFEGEATIDRVVAVMAARDPSRVAVVCGREQLSYGCLELAAGRFAARLLEAGVGPGELVGVSLARTPAMVVALLGILKAGAAYLPLDPSFPEERLAFMVEDAGVKVVVVDADAAGAGDEARQAPAYAAGCAVLQVDSQGGPEQAAFGPVQAVNAAQDLAYVLYTSGSTGRPKGVQIEHGALLNFLRAMQQQPGLEESDRLVAVTTLSFDIAGLELFGPLSVGAQVVIASREQATDGEALAELLERHAATVLQATPATWRLLLESGWKGRAGLKMLCGGEALPAELARALLATGGELWNLYGPTETTVWSTVHRVEQVAGATVPIGRPIANTQVYVLEPGGQPAPIGVAGELCIGGAGLARGYLNRPELTAERFAVIELAGMGPTRVYRTGDVVRWRAEGTLEYVGRRDQQVKVRGFRIELGEIEAALAAVPGVRQAVVVARNDGVAAGDAQLVAYVVAEDPEAPPMTSSVRRQLRRSLPDYMVPSLVLALDSLPLTPNGKIDRQRLPDPLQAAAAEPRVRTLPEPGTEQLLADVWKAVLGIEDVRAEDNFFEIGGHSLLALRVTAAVERRTGQRLDPRSMFFQTLSQLAGQLEKTRAVTAAEAQPS